MTNQTDDLGFIHRFVPASVPGEKLTLLLLHGTGGNENDLLELGRSLASHAALLSARGKVLENGMPRFFRRLAEGVFDLEDLRLRTWELSEFVTAAANAYGFDAGHVMAVGYSNGANIAASVMLTCPDILAGAVLLRAMTPFDPVPLPNLKDVKIFMASGRTDSMVPVASVERLSSIFAKSGAQVTLRWSGGGHGLTAEEIAAAGQWLAPFQNS